MHKRRLGFGLAVAALVASACTGGHGAGQAQPRTAPSTSVPPTLADRATALCTSSGLTHAYAAMPVHVSDIRSLRLGVVVTDAPAPHATAFQDHAGSDRAQEDRLGERR